MAGSINKVILIGNLGADPEVRLLESGVKVCRLSLATSEDYTDRTTGEKITNTEWHRVVLWRGLADIADRYLSKGQKIYIEGKIRTRSWQDESGMKKYSTEIIADRMTMLSAKETSRSEARETPDFQKNKPTIQKKDLGQGLMEDEEDDDLPF